MNEGELKALPRAQLQKLAKSNGVKANGKSVDIIKQLLEYYNAKPADRNDDGLNDAAITRPNVSPSKLALRSKEITAQNTGNAASDMALEPVVPDEDGAPQAGPSGRSDRRVTGATNSEEIAGKGNESVIPRLSQRMHDGEYLSPVQQTAGNSARSSPLGRRTSGVSPFAQDIVEAGSSARTSVLVPRASTVSHSVQGTGESKRGSASTSDMIRRGTSPSRRTGPTRGKTPVDLDDQPSGLIPSVRSLGPQQLQVSAKPPIFKPIVVGERQGEPGYSAPVSTRPTAEDRETLVRNRPSEISRLHSPPPRDPILNAPSVAQPQHVSRTRENLADQSFSVQDSREDERTVVRATQQLRGFAGHARPTVDELKLAVMDLDAKSEDYPQMAHEIARLQRMVGLLQSKEAWLEEALASVQRMRLTLERHYVAKVKAKPWQKEMPARNRETGGRTLGTTDENPFLNSNDGENVTRRLSVREGKRKAADSGLLDHPPHQKRLRQSGVSS